jgi:acetyltransferase-like isoleucine patch superfamily enzyme
MSENESLLCIAAEVKLGGVKIGERAMSGAESVVIRDVSPDTVVEGVPASIVRRLDLRSIDFQ